MTGALPSIKKSPPKVSRRILLADDDRVLSDLLKQFFTNEGFSVTPVFDGGHAVATAAEHSFDIIVIDVMMPVMDGFETLLALRKMGDTPIIMLTARGGDIDRILGLEMGADDYLPKPCNPRELLARIKAILRRADSRLASPHASTLVAGGLTLRPANREARIHSDAVALTDTEFSVLESLTRAQGKLVTKHALSQDVLGRDLGPHDRSLDMHISHLRKKLERAQGGHAAKIVIKTVRGHGFILTLSPED